MKRRRVLTVTVGAMVPGGVLMAGYGIGVTPAGAQAAPPNPLTVIIDKLDQILAALTGAAGQNNHTLRWDTHNPSASRFTTAFPGAVLDKNTGLVWEQAPGTGAYSWFGATSYCVNKAVPASGGTRGWRLPSVAELASLIDPSLPAPFVPASVFTGVQSANYWSATLSANDPTFAWNVNFSNGNVHNDGHGSDHAWCVRGGMNADTY